MLAAVLVADNDETEIAKGIKMTNKSRCDSFA